MTIRDMMNKKISKNHKILSIKNDGNKIRIKFPVKIYIYILFSFVLLVAIISAIFFKDFFSVPEFAVFWLILLILNALNFTIRFFRVLVIDKDKKIITYFSILKKTFRIDDILTLNTNVDPDPEGLTRFYLIISVRKKNIKVETQSEEQSQMLLKEISSFKQNSGLETKKTSD